MKCFIYPFLHRNIHKVEKGMIPFLSEAKSNRIRIKQ